MAAPEGDFLTLPKYEVSAQRFDQTAARVPGDIIHVDASEIADLGATSTVEALEKLAGMEFRSASASPAQAGPVLRGFGENTGQRVLILVDGLPINRVDMGALNWLQVPLHDIERIEVLRGAQTALYGNNAVGGVIKITTRSGLSGETGGVVEAHAGSYESYGASANYRERFSEQWSARFGGGYQEDGGFRDHSFYAAHNASAEVSYTANDWTLSSNIGWTLTDYELPGPLTTLDNPRQSSFGTGEGVTETFSAGTFAERRFSESQRFSLNAGYTRRQLDWTLSGTTATNIQDAFTLSPVFTFEREQTTLLAGADLQYDTLDVTLFQDSTRSADYLVADLERPQAAAFAYADHTLSDSLTLTLGGRGAWSQFDANARDTINNTLALDDTRETWDSAFTAGATWIPNEQFRLWTRLDRLYRLPATDEIATYQGYGLVVPFNADLAPESGWNAELGTSYGARHWRLGVTGFVNWMEDEIGFDRSVSGGGLNINLPDTRRIGLETTAEAGWEQLRAAVTYAWIDAEFTAGPNAGKTVPLVPTHRLTARLDWTPHEDWLFGVFARWSSSAWEGEDYANQNAKLDAYGIVDALVRYHVTEALEVFATVNNVFDKTYASLKFSGVYYPGEGRTLTLGARYTF